jgi:hypothetical protein
MPAYSTPMTLTLLQSYVRNYVLERTGDNGLITDPELIDIINAASRMVWLKIATKYPDVFTSRTPANLTVTAGSSLAFSTVSAGSGVNIFKILFVNVGAVGSTPDQLSPLNEFDRVTFRHIYESYVSTNIKPAIPYRYYVEGQNVYFTPATAGSFDCRVVYIAQPQDMTAGGDILWNGLMPMYHDSVAMLASIMVYAKDGNLQTGFTPVFTYLDSVLMDNFGPMRNPYNDKPINPMSEHPKENRP